MSSTQTKKARRQAGTIVIVLVLLTVIIYGTKLLLKSFPVIPAITGFIILGIGIYFIGQWLQKKPNFTVKIYDIWSAYGILFVYWLLKVTLKALKPYYYYEWEGTPLSTGFFWVLILLVVCIIFIPHIIKARKVIIYVISFCLICITGGAIYEVLQEIPEILVSPDEESREFYMSRSETVKFVNLKEFGDSIEITKPDGKKLISNGDRTYNVDKEDKDFYSHLEPGAYTARSFNEKFMLKIKTTKNKN